MVPPEPAVATRRLAGRDLVIRYVAVGDRDQSALPRMLPQLTAGEQRRAAGFRFAADRLAFALGRILVRNTLSHYAPTPPGGWQFIENAYGKPGLDEPVQDAPIRFNISHCRGMVTAGFALGRDIGVDVEPVDRTGSGVEIARSCFMRDEVRAIESLPEEQRQPAFVATWTLKEAYVKATGLGLSIPLADFAVGLDPPRLSFSPRLADHDGNWFLWQAHPTPRHCLAVAARRRPAEELSVSVDDVALEVLM